MFSIDRHSIKRCRFFASCLAEKQNFVVVDPTTVPAKERFWRDADCFLCGDFKCPERRRRTVPIFAMMRLTHVDGKKKPFSIGRDGDASVTAHAAVRNNFFDVPLSEDCSI